MLPKRKLRLPGRLPMVYPETKYCAPAAGHNREIYTDRASPATTEINQSRIRSCLFKVMGTPIIKNRLRKRRGSCSKNVLIFHDFPISGSAPPARYPTIKFDKSNTIKNNKARLKAGFVVVCAPSMASILDGASPLWGLSVANH